MITKLVELMADKDLREIDLRDGESRISLRRGISGEVVYAGSPCPPPAPAVSSNTPPHGAASAPPAAESDAGLIEIKSPMVGTFYASPSPDAPPFITTGTTVGAETVVCIIEAMKVFNEIKAEVSGRIERILVQNQQPVEFGQPLFLVRPAA